MDVGKKKEKITVLPEYESAFEAFFQESMNSLIRCNNEFLFQIAETEKREKVGNIRTALEGGSYIDKEPAEIQSTFTLSYETIFKTDIEGFIQEIDSTATSAINPLMKQIFELLTEVSEETGQVIDAKGEAFSYDLIIEAIQKMEISFEEDGTPIMPSLVASPNMKKMLEENPASEEQRAKLDEIIELKKGEYFAKKRSRKLHQFIK